MQLVQASHAAFEAGQKTGPEGPEGPEQPYIVLCETASEASLLEAAAMLDNAGIPHVIFTEEDLGGQATAICTLPLMPDQRASLASWKTWKES